MTVSLVGKGIYRFCIGSNVYNIEANNVLQARKEFMRSIEYQVNSSIMPILDNEEFSC